MAACVNNGPEQSFEPIISLNPKTGGVNTLVVVNGENFPADMAVMLRLGPPDVGATPFSYASGVSGPNGRFALSFNIPESWPDGMPINETELTVIAINEDGSLKATAPFTFQPDGVVEPTSLIIDGITTPDSRLIANEQAIVNAVMNYLIETGESTQAAVSVEQIEEEYARVSVHFLSTDSEGTSIGFLKLVEDVWEVLIIGRDFDSVQLLELGIPPSVLPEDMLIPEG